MAKRIVKYNPAFLSKEELVQSFVVRHAELELIVQVLRENVTNSNQHVLVIGPRGIGKTMLALRVVEEIRKEKDLSKRWYPLVFSEESYPVTTPGEFWLEALFHLGQQTGDDRWKQTYHELGNEKDEARLREKALAQLMDFADAECKRVLLVVENFNMLVGEQMQEDHGWTLRHTLLNESRVMLLATATSRFEEIDNSGKAMFELFRTLDLKPLDEGECRTLWNCVTGEELTDERIRPLQILTGGSPRLVAIISTFAARMSLRELMDDLMQLVDDHTEYFKGYIDNLPAVERKAFLALADLWDPATAREVADAARLGVSKTSALLRRLMERGAVVLANGQKRTKLYQVAERMYNIYYLMRRRGAPSRRMKAVVNFMVSFYGQEELIGATQRIAEEACNLEPGLRREHFWAYEAILERSASESFRSKLIKVVPHDFLEMPDTPDAIKNVMEGVEPEEVEVTEVGVLLARAFNLVQSDKFQQAENIYREAIEINDKHVGAWMQLGQLLHEKLERYEEAEKAYRKAIEINEKYAWAWAWLGKLLDEKLERYDEAEQAYRKSVDIEENNASTWVHLGCLLREKLERYEEAESVYRKAIKIDEKYTWAWVGLGVLLHEKLERYVEAESAYRKAIEIDEKNAWAWVQLGKLLVGHFGLHEEAKEAYKKAIELEPKVLEGWLFLGDVLYKTSGNFESVVNGYREILKTKPEAVWGWLSLGSILDLNCHRCEEAERSYRKAIEVNPKSHEAWERLGFLLLGIDDRHEEAEECILTAIKLKPDCFLSWEYLGEVLERQPMRYEESEEAYRKAIELEPHDAMSWLKLGRLLHECIGRYDEAEKAYKKAIEVDEKYPFAWVPHLEPLVKVMYVGDRASKQQEKAILHKIMRPPWAWELLGRLLENKLGRYEEAKDAYCKASEIVRQRCSAMRGLILSKVKGGNWAEASGLVSEYLEEANLVEQNVNDTIELFVGLAAAGYGREALKILAESPSAGILEPLVVGLRIYVGEDVKAAAEIMEVGRDVVKRIEQRKKEMRKKKKGGSRKKRQSK